MSIAPLRKAKIGAKHKKMYRIQILWVLLSSRYNVQKTAKGVRKVTLEKRKQPPVDSIKYADSGYQGWQKLQKKVVIPYKKIP